MYSNGFYWLLIKNYYNNNQKHDVCNSYFGHIFDVNIYNDRRENLNDIAITSTFKHSSNLSPVIKYLPTSENMSRIKKWKIVKTIAIWFNAFA